MYAGHASLSQAETRYFLTHYITVCERFDYSFAQSDYEECGAFNSARLNQAMYVKWSRANPSSPLNVHKDGSNDSVRIVTQHFDKCCGVAASEGFVQIMHLLSERGGG